MPGLLEVLERRGREEPGKVAFRFHKEPPCTYGVLWRECSRVGSVLLHRGVKLQEPVLIAIGNGCDFFYAFYGVQRAGGIAVPVFPGSGVERILKLADLSGASIILVSGSFSRDKREELTEGAAKKGRCVLLVEECLGDRLSDDGAVVFPAVQAGDTAFIQFTSGSTGNPRGVILSHANLVANMEMMIAGLGITGADRFVSWLPVYHDMGLILMTMVPFYLGLELDLLPTGLNYLKSWLSVISERGGTFTAAPDFAYRLCMLYVRDAGNYDLSGLRVALNAAEPVRSGTIRRFEGLFGLENVLLPAYGLAEATVGVCGWRPGKVIKTDARGLVSIGRPFPDVEMRIVGEDGGVAASGESGEICVKSRACTVGYYGNVNATKELFDGDGFIRTGDLGYCDGEGDYFIVGRKKNIIIRNGLNIAAGEVEELVEVFSFVRRSAAVGIDRGKSEGEQVYIFIEVKLKRTQLESEEALEDIVVGVVERFDGAFGFHPGRVYLVKPGGIPMTNNGKIKYPELKKLYSEGKLREQGLILFPEY